MKVIKKRLMVLFLSAILLANTLVLSTGFAVASSEEAATLAEESSIPATAASPNLPKSYEYVLDTDGIEVGGVYAITYLLNGTTNRLLFCNNTATDVVFGTVTDNKLTLYSGFESGTQLWEVVSIDNNGGLALKSMFTGGTYYLDLSKLSTTKVHTSGQPVEVTIANGTTAGTYTIKDASTNNWLSYNTNSKQFSTANQGINLRLFKQTELPVKIVEPNPPKGTTEGQPFDTGTGGSENFRIPSIITLSDGTLVASADVRWNHNRDGRAVDVIVSTSKDNGKTWKYSMPMYFNDSIDAKPSDGTYKMLDYAATFIDPVLAKDNDDKIYLLADLFPGSVAMEAEVPQKPAAASGYVMIGGKQRLVLYKSNQASQQSNTNYNYYVGDYGQEGLAPVYEVLEPGQYSTVASYYLDRSFYLYDASKQPMYCLQIGNPRAAVKQNVFFYNADLHVRCANYLYLITSEDGGETWSDPTILNPQVRTDNQESFYGSGVGVGLCLEDGTVMFSCYGYRGTTDSMRSSFIYTRDGGVTWKRSEDATSNSVSSESTLVKINETTVRQFFRSFDPVVSYVDYTLQGEDWVTDHVVTTLNEVVKANNQLSALRLSRTVDHKPVIMISAASATNKRADGRIYTYVLESNNSMKLVDEHDVYPIGGVFPNGQNYPDGTEFYGYSSLTELKDGSIGLLVETLFSTAKIAYTNIPLAEVAPDVTFDDLPKSYEYVLDTDGIEVGGVYAITYRLNDATNRLLFCNNTMTDVVFGTVTDNKLTLNSGFEAGTQLWEVVSVDGGIALKSKYSEATYYLDLSKRSGNNVHTSGTPVKVTIADGTIADTHTIKDASADIWLGYHTNTGKFSATTSDMHIEVFFYKQTEVPVSTIESNPHE